MHKKRHQDAEICPARSIMQILEAQHMLLMSLRELWVTDNTTATRFQCKWKAGIHYCIDFFSLKYRNSSFKIPVGWVGDDVRHPSAKIWFHSNCLYNNSSSCCQKLPLNDNGGPFFCPVCFGTKKACGNHPEAYYSSLIFSLKYTLGMSANIKKEPHSLTWILQVTKNPDWDMDQHWYC